MATIMDGIIIGAAGGSIAGLTVWVVQYIHDKVSLKCDGNKIYKWLCDNTDEAGNQFRSSRAIASWNNLTIDRVRYVSSIDDRIFLSTGQNEDTWGVFGHSERSAYETRGARSL